MFFGLACLNWHGYGERFYCRISSFRDWSASCQHGIFDTMYFGTFSFIQHAFLTIKWVMFSGGRQRNAPVCRSTASIQPTYLPQNQTSLECSLTHVILGDQSLCSFWQTILKILAWNSERKGCCIARQFLGRTVLSFWRELFPKEDPTFNYNYKNTCGNKFTCTILITLFSSQNWVYVGQNSHTLLVRRDEIFIV